MLSDWVEPQWRRRRGVRTVQVVAVLAALLAALSLLGMFNQFGASDGDVVKAERQLVASVDLRVGNPAGAVERGEAKARADIKAGVLQLQIFGPPKTKVEAAKAQRLEKRYGVDWVYKGEDGSLLARAFANGYNGVMRAEIERRHGSEALDQLMREHGIESPKQKESP
jgi:hypothetical protein